jgi:aarF domain-containing kinase
MAGKRLLDVAALFNASRGVAQKHVALRARQVDIYNRTSTLAKAVKNQTDRVTETVKAASFLASRLNESGPAWTSETADNPVRSGTKTDGPIPSKESTEGSQTPKSKDGIEQDHFYERSTQNSTSGPAPKDNLEIKQERAGSYPLPDGTIPPANSGLNNKLGEHEVIPARPQDEGVKRPLGNEGLKPPSSSENTVPPPSRKPLSAEAARILQRQSKLQIPSISADTLDEIASGPLEKAHDEGSFHRISTHTSPVFSSLPRVKIPKHISSTQGDDPHLPAMQLNLDSFSTSGPSESISAVTPTSAENEVPEGVDTALFYSPRVARLLGGQIQRFKEGSLELNGVKDMPVGHIDPAANKDQGTLNTHTYQEDHPTVPNDSASMHAEVPRTSTLPREDVKKITLDIPNDLNGSHVKVRRTVARRRK